MVEPRWEVKIGSPVTVTDGDYGRLQQLLVDPGQERVVGLLVRPHGWLPYHPVVVPENAIAEASEDEVRLNINREQLEALPEYLSDSELIVDGRNYRVDHELLLIRAGQQVFCRDESPGWVSLILLDPAGRVKGFVLHTGHLLGRNLIVPIAWVQEVRGNHVYLSVEKSDLQGLPDYGLDDALAAEVEAALWSDEILRNTDYNEIGVSVEDGIVKLRGHVISMRNKTRAEEAACSVPGVLGLENDLVLDQDLANGVAQALGNDEHTRFARISIGAQNGFITLNGRVDRADLREAAESIAAGVPQVRGVINTIQAPNVVTDPKEHQVWQPLIGKEVCTRDMQLGHVERVIIDPRNRRVTAFVVRGNFPDPWAQDDYRLPGEDAQQECSVVIPIDAVRYATDSSVLLDVSGAEAALYRTFEPADFTSPSMGWISPYPYHWKQVLFDGERLEEL
jgi:osmotically-inducible protein OsmY/sporulation protein YlmC with PRC-barrel domain